MALLDWAMAGLAANNEAARVQYNRLRGGRGGDGAVILHDFPPPRGKARRSAVTGAFLVWNTGTTGNNSRKSNNKGLQ
ncbi:hypothetical protein GDR29_23635 [Xanthomonas oryzae pv. oryzae]|nr:hypothetical protein GDR29_23635 [Xanthomonas oryzae pv. oryzae]